jgi:hypothetical protein
LKLGTEIAFVQAEEKIYEGGKKIVLRFTIRKRSAQANGIYRHGRDVGNDLHT